MRKLGRIFIRIVLVLIVLLVSAVALLYVASERALGKRYDAKVHTFPIPTDDEAIARGKHLVEDRYICAECHGNDYGGKMFLDEGPLVGRIATPNITAGAGGVGRTYTDLDWIRTLRHGIAPDGRSLVIMPAHHIGHGTDQELGDAIAYLKSLPPVDRSLLTAMQIGPLGRLLLVQQTAELIPASAIDHANAGSTMTPVTVVQRGEQLSITSGCIGCHKPDFTGGGGPPPGSSNITPVGLGRWTRDDFFRTIRTGHTPDGRELSEAMPRAFANMTDEELDALWTYLRTVPSKGDLSDRQKAGRQQAALRPAS